MWLQHRRGCQKIHSPLKRKCSIFIVVSIYPSACSLDRREAWRSWSGCHRRTGADLFPPSDQTSLLSVSSYPHLAWIFLKHNIKHKTPKIISYQALSALRTISPATQPCPMDHYNYIIIIFIITGQSFRCRPCQFASWCQKTRGQCCQCLQYPRGSAGSWDSGTVFTDNAGYQLSSYSISPLSMVPFPSMSSMSKASSAALMKSSPPILIFFPSIFNLNQIKISIMTSRYQHEKYTLVANLSMVLEGFRLLYIVLFVVWHDSNCDSKNRVNLSWSVSNIWRVINVINWSKLWKTPQNNM